MKKNSPWYVASVLVVLLVSCLKEKSVDTSGTGSEKGNWRFAGITAETSQTSILGAGAAATSSTMVLNFNTFNNDGVIKLDGSKIITTGMTFTVDTTAIVYSDMAGLLDTLEVPYAFSLPATSGTTGYKKVSADSLSLDNNFINIPVGTGVMTSGLNGCKLAFLGDTVMTMTQIADDVQVNMILGTPQTQISHSKSVIRLRKI